MAQSQYGLDLKNADVELKKLGFEGYTGLPSYLARSAEQAVAKTQPDTISTKIWFVPERAGIAIRKDVIAILDLRIGVQARVLNDTRDEAGMAFAHDLANCYERISANNERIGRLRALFALAGLAEGILSLEDAPDLSYWQSTYPVAHVQIEPTYPLISRTVTYKSAGSQQTMIMDGGVEMKALVSSLPDQDVTALRDLVLTSRPKADSLLWTVPLSGWKVPGAPLLPGATLTTGDLGDIPGTSFTKQFMPAGGTPINGSEHSNRATPLSRVPLNVTPLNDGLAPVHLIQGDPSGVIQSTTGPGKRGGRGGGVTWPPSWNPSGSQGKPPLGPQPKPGGSSSPPWGGNSGANGPRGNGGRPDPGTGPVKLNGVKLDSDPKRTGTGGSGEHKAIDDSKPTGDGVARKYNVPRDDQ